MGIDYSVNLYYKKHQIEDAILGVISIADLIDEESTEVELPDGKKMKIPFETIPKKDFVKIASDQKFTNFCTLLNFPIDQPLLEYLENNNARKAKGLASIGCIYLDIKVGETYTEFSFTAATSNMSRLFLESKSIQQTFINLLEKTEGLFGLFDIEESFYLSLFDLNKQFGNCGKKTVKNEYDSTTYNIDNFAEICLLHQDCCL
jgi:hypothetical protein